MRTARSIPLAALAVGLLLLAGCYVEEGSVETVENDTTTGAEPAGATTDLGGRPASGSTLGKARDTARGVVKDAEARSAEAGRVLDDPDETGGDEPE